MLVRGLQRPLLNTVRLHAHRHVIAPPLVLMINTRHASTTPSNGPAADADSAVSGRQGRRGGEEEGEQEGEEMQESEMDSERHSPNLNAYRSSSSGRSATHSGQNWISNQSFFNLLQRVWEVAFLAAIVLVVVSIVLLLEPPTKYLLLHVSGSSMEPTFLHGDWLIVRRPSRQSGRLGSNSSIANQLQRGDVVVVRTISDPNVRMVKRIVALQGDTVTRRPDRRFRPSAGSHSTVTVPHGHVWLEGDNASTSSDSNRYGTFPMGLLVGRVERVVRIGWKQSPSGIVPLYTERVKRGQTDKIVDFENRVNSY